MTQIFISYAREDFKPVSELRQRLAGAGFTPWMDKVDLVPGQRWRPAIEEAIRKTDFFVLCLSNHTVKKRGFVQYEIKMALDLWQQMLGDDIYLIPVLLEPIEADEIPDNLREINWVFLYEEDGWDELLRALKHGAQQRSLDAAHKLKQQQAEQRRAEDARLRAVAESANAERLQREEAARRQQEQAERQRLAEAQRKQQEENDRQLREAHAREIQRRQEEELRKRNQPPLSPPAPGQGRKRWAILAGALLLAALVGYWLWSAARSSDGQTQLVAKPAPAPGVEPTKPPPLPEPIEVLRYEQKDATDGSFRLHFKPQQNGYLYLVALDDQKPPIPITLLTNRHAYEVTGSSNRLTAGKEFIFPPKRPLMLSGDKQTAEFTLVFSPAELKKPAFLDAASLRSLTTAEQSALAELERQAKQRGAQADGARVTTLPSSDKPLAVKLPVRKAAKP
ncbi:MAG: TIR domain-containing protein [Acidobacteria bacterium]|nr:TIR domain-containing protein [Acidobacteriota bacterium]MBI3427107.1 TIR domain-containing protein [Acidobacteriota bacterium]